MKRAPLGGTERFEADQHGIVALKAEFLDEADEFLWLRKGEDFGGDVIGYMSAAINALADRALIDLVKNLPVYTDAAQKVAELYPSIRQSIKRAASRFRSDPWTKKPKDLRLLLWPDDTNEQARPLYERQGYEVRFYPSQALTGSLRLYLNEKRFCLFFRTGDNSFFGLVGADEETRSQLSQLFEDEWSRARKPTPWGEFEQSRHFYHKHFETLYQTYAGKYIALIEGEVVDSDSDFSSLAMRVYEKYGYKDIYMPKVERERTVRVSGPRLYHS
ncbi:MAG: hypothetical protein HYY01_14780 [Chloroflexi bacterium]|nr:hypothetical protein [Chloroflexota bacterium]